MFDPTTTAWSDAYPNADFAQMERQNKQRAREIRASIAQLQAEDHVVHRDLLQEKIGLTPIDVDWRPNENGTPVTLEVWEPRWLGVVGCSCNNTRGQIKIDAMEKDGYRLCRDVDASVFNRHPLLVPLDIGLIHQMLPFVMSFHMIGVPTHVPNFRFTLWCQTMEQLEEQARYDALTDEGFWKALEDLRHDPPNDPRVRALLDKLARGTAH